MREIDEEEAVLLNSILNSVIYVKHVWDILLDAHKQSKSMVEELNISQDTDVQFVSVSSVLHVMIRDTFKNNTVKCYKNRDNFFLFIVPIFHFKCNFNTMLMLIKKKTKLPSDVKKTCKYNPAAVA